MWAAREFERRLAAGLQDQFIYINKTQNRQQIDPGQEADEAKAKTPST